MTHGRLYPKAMSLDLRMKVFMESDYTLKYKLIILKKIEYKIYVFVYFI